MPICSYNAHGLCRRKGEGKYCVHTTLCDGFRSALDAKRTVSWKGTDLPPEIFQAVVILFADDFDRKVRKLHRPLHKNPNYRALENACRKMQYKLNYLSPTLYFYRPCDNFQIGIDPKSLAVDADLVIGTANKMDIVERIVKTIKIGGMK